MIDIPTDGLVLDTYAGVGSALGDGDLSRSLDRERYEAGSILEDVLMMLDGDDHRDRRRVENALFRRDTLELYERREFPAIINSVLDQLIGDGGSADLLTIGAMLTVELAARTAGIDIDPSSNGDRRRLVELLEVFAEGVSLDTMTGDLATTKGKVRAALGAFEAEYYASSLEARKQAIARVERNEISEDELPRDILTTLLRAQTQLDLGPDQLLRETAFFLEAGAHTSSQSLATSMHYIFSWVSESQARVDALRSDPLLLQRCVHEALRLRPTNPLIKRRAMRTTVVSGEEVQAGTMLYLNTYEANRDEAVFGATADVFDPERNVPASAARYGHSFGGGLHACIGRNLAIGYPVRGDQVGEDHLYGLVTLMAQALLRRGVRPDDRFTATRDHRTTRWTRWSSYPVLIAPDSAPAIR